MSRKFQVKIIPSAWLEDNGRRLDCGPYLSGAIEAKELLKNLPTVPLASLTSDRNGGIFNGPRFPRIYVDDAANGVPFLGSTDILDADLSYLSLLSNKQVRGNPALVVDEGWTLITCSGTIGRMAYARADMSGMAGSQHFMRVAPDTSKIRPGYLYAYLSSRFGVPLVVSGTYGAIIQHIEPQHIADLPVPRLGDAEERSHHLVQQAADKRVQASKVVETAIQCLEVESGLNGLSHIKHENIPFGVGTISSSKIGKRMDGAFHSSFHLEVLNALETASVPMTTVAARALSVVEPKRFKRVHIDDSDFGIPLFGTSALMWADPQPSFLIPRSMDGVEDLLIDQRTVLIPRSGQVSGIIGTAVLPYGSLIGGAVSEHAIRIHCATETIAGFLFVVLRSEYGRRQLKARAYGSSIPSLDEDQIRQVLVPDVNEDIVEKIGGLGLLSATLRHEAIDLENLARAIVERAIEEGGRS